MPLYKYKAINSKSKVTYGKVRAVNLNDLREKLQNMNYQLLAANIKNEFSYSSFGKGFKEHHIIDIFVHLEKIMALNIPLLEGLYDVVAGTTSSKLKNIVNEVRNAVSDGKMLHEALALYPNVFSSVIVGIIGAGEKSGNIVEILHYLIKYMQWKLAVKNKLLRATYYPIVLLIMALGALVFMFIKVLPKMLSFLHEQDMIIPFYTRALIATAGFVAHKWYYIILFVALITAIQYFTLKFFNKYLYWWHFFKLKLPVLGNLALRLDISYFSYLFAVSLRSKIGVIEACDIGASVVNNLIVKDAMQDVKTSVTNGNPLSSSLEVSGYFPEMVVKLVKIGETTGSLPEMMEKIANYYDEEAKLIINNLAATINPAMIMCIGLLLMWIVIGVFGPMYQNLGHMIKEYQ
ncbi:putative Type II secretion system F family protein [Candidatus Xenohaliotis californiensis]|uniref:Type II secretion system F family protein n=1 Tax=Candidatus Xenohaliotis californiensis TaxID=84677 RepID=A0ABM9N820_9RICK|nr:putative Type II secretion system F family protein [Candidatus Xenohaliotis californiensis]